MVTSEALPAIDWRADDAFQIDGVTFRVADAGRSEPSGRNFILVKTRALIERYLDLIDSLRPKRVVELGIYEGGSAAFFTLLTRPERLVALDIKSEQSIGLEEFINEREVKNRVRTHYSFDQADGVRLRLLVADEFAGSPIDLVVDDASHCLEPTRASFNALFPRLRPGGVFVIEDWSRLHKLDAAFAQRVQTDYSFSQKLDEHARSKDVGDGPLSILLFQLVLASAYAPELVAEIVIADGWAHVVRGHGHLDPDDFDLSDVYSDVASQLIAPTR